MCSKWMLTLAKIALDIIQRVTFCFQNCVTTSDFLGDGYRWVSVIGVWQGTPLRHNINMSCLSAFSVDFHMQHYTLTSSPSARQQSTTTTKKLYMLFSVALWQWKIAYCPFKDQRISSNPNLILWWPFQELTLRCAQCLTHEQVFTRQ